MAVIIEANYSKKLGLPGFSSHSYSVTIRTELANVGQVERESSHLYSLLQSSVDREIQEAGFVPGATESPTGHSGRAFTDTWKCSEKQRALILKIVEEHALDKEEINALAGERFNAPIHALNRLQASDLIKELIERYPAKRNGTDRPGQRRSYGRVGTR